MRKSFVSTFALLVVGSLRIFAQEPVVGAADGEALFHD
jgi:hypothetical protein